MIKRTFFFCIFIFCSLSCSSSVITSQKYNANTSWKSSGNFIFSSPLPEEALDRIPFKSVSSKILIVLDAGHGGKDFGTHSLNTPKFQEKFLNLSTTQAVKNFLEQFGYKVILTRNSDTFIPLDERAEIANKINPKLFVSIHYNSAPSQEAEGIEVYYYNEDENPNRTKKSKMLAQSVLDKAIKNTQAKSRGIKHGNFAVIRETKMPAILIEGGFLTNTSEMDKIKDASYLKSLALGIAEGIHAFLAKENVLATN